MIAWCHGFAAAQQGVGRDSHGPSPLPRLCRTTDLDSLMSVATGRRLAIGLVSVAAALVASTSVHSAPSATPVPAQRFISPQGSDGNSCSKAAPCLSLNRAYRAARPGDVVEMAAGNYSGDQSIGYDPSKTSSTDVVFRPAAGATVSFPKFDIRGSHVTIDGSTGNMRVVGGFSVHSNDASEIARDITIAHLDARGDQITIDTSDGVTLTDLDIGGFCGGGTQEDALLISRNVAADNGAKNVIVQDSRIGNICLPADNPSAHPDCIAVDNVDGLIFRRNKVWWCGTQGFYTDAWEPGAVLRNVLVESNMFGNCDTPGDLAPTCFNSIHIRTNSTNVAIRNNSIALDQPGGIYVQDARNVQVYGNAGKGPNLCANGNATFAYNVWADQKCSPTDVRANPLFLNNSTGPDFDLHLQPTSPAIGRGDPTRHPANDVDIQPRTSPPDAGADERPWLSASVTRRVTLKLGTTKLRRLALGLYKVSIRDASTSENFHLKGPGVNRKSSIKGTLSATWMVRLRKGVYSYGSDANPASRDTLVVEAPAR